MKPITLYSWGYWGWGGSVKQFLRCTEAVEAAGEFNPPIFVDIRISRSVRALGFRDRAFETLLGAERHHWMPELGNRAIVDGTEGITINNPKASADLLDLAISSAKDRRHVIFFCSCEFPAGCHRAVVAKLVQREAKKRGIAVEIVEWPGGNASEMDIKISKGSLASLMKGAAFVPIGKQVDLGQLGGIPWGSVIQVSSGSEAAYFISGPPSFRRSQWCLPAFDVEDDSDAKTWLKRKVERWRKKNGYAPLRSD
jgi:hypothetical protein